VGGGWERLWDNGIYTAEILQLPVLSFVTVNSQSKNHIFFHYPRVFPGDHPLTKKPEDSAYEIDYQDE